MKSGVDEKEEDGNYTLRFDESRVLQEMTSLLDSLDPNAYSEQLINSVINEIVEYMMYRIRRNNQQCWLQSVHANNQDLGSMTWIVWMISKTHPSLDKA